MIDCKQQISLLNEIRQSKIVLDEIIKEFNALKELDVRDEKIALLHKIYSIRKEIKSKIKEVRKIKFDIILDNKPELKEYIIEQEVTLKAKYKTKLDLFDALVAHDPGSLETTRKIIFSDDFKITSEDIKKKLVIFTVETMGFGTGATVKQICDYAVALGLELCPAEMAPRLLLQNPDNLIHDLLIFGMKPITNIDGKIGILGVVPGKPGNFILHFSKIKNFSRCHPQDVFVFCRN